LYIYNINIKKIIDTQEFPVLFHALNKLQLPFKRKLISKVIELLWTLILKVSFIIISSAIQFKAHPNINETKRKQYETLRQHNNALKLSICIYYKPNQF
jgi:hypothetical protein